MQPVKFLILPVCRQTRVGVLLASCLKTPGCLDMDVIRFYTCLSYDLKITLSTMMNQGGRMLTCLASEAAEERACVHFLTPFGRVVGMVQTAADFASHAA
jgi:hypothetical protein